MDWPLFKIEPMSEVKSISMRLTPQNDSIMIFRHMSNKISTRNPLTLRGGFTEYRKEWLFCLILDLRGKNRNFRYLTNFFGALPPIFPNAKSRKVSFPNSQFPEKLYPESNFPNTNFPELIFFPKLFFFKCRFSRTIKKNHKKYKNLIKIFINTII